MQPKGKTITVSGCVERASETGATATTGASDTAAKFELTNAAIAGGSTASEAAGTSGTASAAKTYRLDATDAQLSAHLNHKVEVTGTLEEATPGASGTASETTGTSGTSKAAAPRLKVESVKMVSATCP
jgi:hypothetical protein